MAPYINNPNQFEQWKITTMAAPITWFNSHSKFPIVLKLTITDRGIEAYDETGFVAEFAREDNGRDVVFLYNAVKNLSVIEMQHSEQTEWGLSTNGSNPTDEEFFPMPQKTAFNILRYFLNHQSA